MASFTRGELAVQVAGMLGLFDGSMDPAVQDNILKVYDGVYQELLDDGIVTWAQTGEEEAIPVRFRNSLVSLVAASDVLLCTYPQPADQINVLKAAAMAAGMKIRRQLASAQDAERTTTEYF